MDLKDGSTVAGNGSIAGDRESDVAPRDAKSDKLLQIFPFNRSQLERKTQPKSGSEMTMARHGRLGERERQEKMGQLWFCPSGVGLGEGTGAAEPNHTNGSTGPVLLPPDLFVYFSLSHLYGATTPHTSHI